MKVIKIIVCFISVVLVTFLLASITGTQLVLADILSFGLTVSLPDRISATLHDITGLVIVLPLLIGAAFLVAFFIAMVAERLLGGNRNYWYMAAGMASLPAALVFIKLIMGATIFAAARTGLGLLLISLCGLAGGWLFARLTHDRKI